MFPVYILHKSVGYIKIFFSVKQRISTKACLRLLSVFLCHVIISTNSWVIFLESLERHNQYYNIMQRVRQRAVQNSLACFRATFDRLKLSGALRILRSVSVSAEPRKYTV